MRVKVLHHPDPSLKGLEGVVIEETRNALRVLVNDGRLVTVLKHSSTLEVERPGGGYIRLRGEELLGDPVERLKEYRWRVRRRCRG
ncbi:MAG: ribonuclease P protein subunit [Desulfurococcales archaeon]|nr:ribonuclease P protein subunit [Desulfurococcales archaeon]